MRLALPLCLALLALLSVSAEIAPPKGHVLITLGGAVTEANLPARGLDDGGLFSFLEVDHPAAVGFDAAMLDALPQMEITIPYGPEGKERTTTFSGPHLAAVMEMAGAAGKTARPMAMDGYQAEISWQEISDHNPILATHADGKPMGIGAYGPTMIVFPPTDDDELRQTQSSQQVWALAYIGIE